MNFIILLVCEKFITDRKKYLHQMFTYRPNIVKFQTLFSSKNKLTILNLCKFINIINKRIFSPGQHCYCTYCI